MRDEHRLAAGELADAPVEGGGGEADLGEGLGGARLDVPVVAEDVEVALRRRRRPRWRAGRRPCRRCRAGRRRVAPTARVRVCGR